MKKFIDFKSLLLILAFCAYLALFCSGCASQRRCERKFPVQTSVIIKDSIREVIQYRDTTIFVHLPAVTVTKTDTVYIKNGVIQFREVRASSNYATARAWLALNRINLTLMDKDTTLQFRLENALKTARYWEMKYSTETKTLPPVKYTPKFWKFTGWIGIIFILAVVGYFGIKIAKKFWF